MTVRTSSVVWLLLCILYYVYVYVTLSTPALRLQDPNKRLLLV